VSNKATYNGQGLQNIGN